MAVKELKSCTVYNKAGKAVVVKQGETWMEGHFGVIVIGRIEIRDKMKSSKSVSFVDKLGHRWCATANDMGCGNWDIKLNVLFKIEGGSK